jgi:DNA-binding MarR family transcriptional regulator
VTLKQAYLLRQLARNDFLYPSRIAELLFCDPPTVSVVVGNLEEKGWVERERDPDDARRTRVTITAKGRRKYDSLASDLEDGEETGFDPLSCLSSDEVDRLEDILSRLYGHLNDIEKQGDQGDETQ